MRREYNEQADLDLVSAYLSARGLMAKRFPQEDTQRGKTPDFRVLRQGAVVAYCEVKAPNDPWLDDLLDQAPPGTIVGGARDDPTFNRIARHVEKAAAQFASVNADRAVINILAYVNHDRASNFGDLRETLTGYFYAASGSRYPTMLRIAEGRIGKAKRTIDAFLWFDSQSGRMVGAVINQVDPQRTERTCSLLGFNADKII
ncbi:hypothetical protein KXS07_10465 [Inquilinus limosus]|uniref:hypothetical protein n=1 Tax=Inquilinus limosus TaxID=171674 RepID=UPI003F15BD1C